jgi:hypothetical protein
MQEKVQASPKICLSTIDMYSIDIIIERLKQFYVM